MPRRMLHLLGPLLAVAAIVAVPSASSGATHSTARASGDPGGGCYDHNPPSSGWGNGWWHHDGNHNRYWHGWGDGHGYFGGSSWDYGCDALHPGTVARVNVAVAKMRDGKCQHLLGSGGRLSRSRSCGVRHWLTATGTDNWRYEINRRLPHGRYRLHRRAVDGSGNYEAPDVWHVRIK